MNKVDKSAKRDHSPINIRNENHINIKIPQPDKPKRKASKPKVTPSLAEIENVLNNLEYNDQAITTQHGGIPTVSGGSIVLPNYNKPEQSFNSLSQPDINTNKTISFTPEEIYNYFETKLLKNKSNENSQSQDLTNTEIKDHLSNPNKRTITSSYYSKPKITFPSGKKGRPIGSKNKPKDKPEAKPEAKPENPPKTELKDHTANPNKKKQSTSSFKKKNPKLIIEDEEKNEEL